ncbi:MAG TPA: transposase [Chthonomonadaceae bacterium]|nr:transposase [Chthonomonadaceae bacterium]
MRRSPYKQYASPEAAPTQTVLEHPTKPGVFLPVHRRPMRLQGVDYTSPELVCFVTFNVETECEVRFTGEIGRQAWGSLIDELERIGCRLFAACLMPDHAHLLVSPSGTGESVSDIVRRVKTRCCAVLRQEQNIYLRWQASFYDHILRDVERQVDEFQAIRHYIYSNPERAALGEAYPFRMLSIP